MTLWGHILPGIIYIVLSICMGLVYRYPYLHWLLAFCIIIISIIVVLLWGLIFDPSGIPHRTLEAAFFPLGIALLLKDTIWWRFGMATSSWINWFLFSMHHHHSDPDPEDEAHQFFPVLFGASVILSIISAFLSYFSHPEHPPLVFHFAAAYMWFIAGIWMFVIAGMVYGSTAVWTNVASTFGWLLIAAASAFFMMPHFK